MQDILSKRGQIRNRSRTTGNSVGGASGDLLGGTGKSRRREAAGRLRDDLRNERGKPIVRFLL
jgi:hypothetical protein